MKFKAFKNRGEASGAAAQYLHNMLSQALDLNKRTTLIVSGGSSPLCCFKLLSRKTLDWSSVDITLSDERVVPTEHTDSNEKMVRSTLLKDEARAATFYPAVQTSIPHILGSIACSLIGMGEDGHFASIFPDLAELPALTDRAAKPGFQLVITAASEHPRVTANLSLLLCSRGILLLVFGDNKKQLLENPGNRPISTLLNQDTVPVEVYWAP